MNKTLVLALLLLLNAFAVAQKTAPVWKKIGNTGLPTQNWGLIFDNAGVMYASANNSPSGGVSKSTDKGYTWTVINTGFTCSLHRGMGVAPDGTVFVGNDFCTNYNQGPNHFYWLDNVHGSGTVWTQVTVPKSNGGGAIGYSVIANDGFTIVSATYSGIWLSTDNARSWFLAPGNPTQFTENGPDEELVTYKNWDGVIYVGTANAGVFYSKDNGYHWDNLGYPPGNNTKGDVWAIGRAPAGPYNGYVLVGAGNAAAKDKTGTGLWCYGPAAPPDGNWYFCGNNQYGGPNARHVDVTQIVENRTRNKSIIVYYGDIGISPMYSTDGVNWDFANSGLAPDASTEKGGANTSGMAIDPSTGLVYMVLKNGDIYVTKQSQDLPGAQGK